MFWKNLALIFLLAFSGNSIADEAPAAPIYPRDITLPGGKVVVHHPQVADWQNFEVLSAWVPMEVAMAGSNTTWTGSVLVEADTEILFDERLVKLSHLRLAKARPDQGLSDAAQALQQSPAAHKLVLEAMSKGSQTMGLESLLRALPDDFAESVKAPASKGLSFAPPRIIISNRPAQLMLIDGPPVKSKIEGTGLEFVVNTNWDVFHYLESDAWYLISNDAWLRNTMLAGGDWLAATSLPNDFQLLAMRTEFEGLREVLPPRAPEKKPVPITISYDAAELVVIDGPAELAAIPGTGLDYVTNTQQDLFFSGGNYYLLLSGRWFKARDLKGDWSSVKQLPTDFSAISRDHDKGHVLAAVPGTAEARLALIEAALPHDRLVLATAGEGLEVEYAGTPEFVPIKGTPLRRAANTPYQVIQHNNFYYLCDDGAWFMSTAPEGPWSVATQLPAAIYDIPPSDPAYNVTFVKLKEFDKKSGKVAYSYTNGYRGTYSTGATVVFGTGWSYPGSVYYRGGYPVYGYYPPSYGYGAWYHPAWGRYGYRGWYDPYWGYPRSTSITISEPVGEKDWEWDLDGTVRTVYGQGTRNYIGSGTYQMDGSKPYKAVAQAGPTEKGNSGPEDIIAGPGGVLYRRVEGRWQTYSDGAWLPAGGNIPPGVLNQYDAMQAGYHSYDQFKAHQDT